MLKNDRLIKALLRQPVDQTPVWLMRQAGRYLPEYRQLRAQAPDFIQFCKTPELAIEATMQPLARFDLDAAIMFSDILVIPEAMGMVLEFIPGRGPVLAQPIASLSQVKALAEPDIDNDLGYVMQVIKGVRSELNGRVPLIGFAGSPWTLAAYMIEGQGSRMWSQVRKSLYQTPVFVHALLQRLTHVIIAYLNAQVEAGAQALMVFDTWGGILSHTGYTDFSLSYLRQIADGVKRSHDGQRIPLVFFTKQAAPWLDKIAMSGCDAVGLDASVDLVATQQLIGDRVAIQGNIDPWLLYANVDTIQSEVRQIFSGIDPTGFVFNLGHGVDKDTPVEHVAALIDAVKKYGKVSVDS